MGAIHVHEFMSFDGVVDAPAWSAAYEFVPRMGELIGSFVEGSAGSSKTKNQFTHLSSPLSS